MIITEKVVVTREETKIIKQICDLCGREASQPGWQWCGTIFEIDQTEIVVTVRHKEGSQYPDHGSGTKIEIDLCPSCFKDKLVPWLRGQGAQIDYQDWDY